MGMDSVLPRLHLGDQTPHASYRAEMTGDAGGVVWSRGELRRQPAGEFILWIDHAGIPAGRYQLRIFGLDASGEKMLATYTFELSDAEP